jgi:ribosomal protein S6--L-glutamate ligase
MKIGYVSRLGASSPSFASLQAAIRTRRHELVVMNPITAELCYPPPALPRPPDVTLTRIGGTSPLTAQDLVRHLEARGGRCVNTAASLSRSSDKVSMLGELARLQLPMPRSVVLPCVEDPGRERLGRALASLGGPPWVAKLPRGNKGQGVVVVESVPALWGLADWFLAVGQPLLLQAFVRSTPPGDCRVIVVGGRVLAAMRRYGEDGELRANVHLGGRVERLSPSPELAALAVRAADAFGLEIAGVDLMEGPEGAVVIEVNSSPGVIGIQRALDAAAARHERIDVAEEMVRYLESVDASREPATGSIEGPTEAPIGGP